MSTYRDFSGSRGEGEGGGDLALSEGSYRLNLSGVVVDDELFGVGVVVEVCGVGGGDDGVGGGVGGGGPAAEHVHDGEPEVGVEHQEQQRVHEGVHEAHVDGHLEEEDEEEE